MSFTSIVGFAFSKSCSSSVRIRAPYFDSTIQLRKDISVFRSETKVPLPCLLTRYPSETSMESACRMVEMLVPKSEASFDSLGIASPGLYCPSAIRFRSISLT